MKIEDLQKQVTPPGIYFNMSNEDYHNDRSISNSGMGKLLKTPLHYWHDSPFNPFREKLDTDAYRKGRAYHTLVLEPEKFKDDYILLPPVNDLKIDSEFWEYLSKSPDAKDFKLPATKTAKVVKYVGEKTVIREKEYNDLLLAVKYLKSDKMIFPLFTCGYPEVSIFWVDEETGVPCRVRIDYLTHKIATDLKSTSDVGNYKLGYSIVDYGYHRQAAFYLEGIRNVKKTIDNSDEPISHFEEWLDNFAKEPTDNFAFVFQEMKPPNVYRADSIKWCREDNSPPDCDWQEADTVRQLGEDAYKRALIIFKENYEKYGDSRWGSGYEGKIGLIQIDDLPPKIYY